MTEAPYITDVLFVFAVDVATRLGSLLVNGGNSVIHVMASIAASRRTLVVSTPCETTGLPK